MDRHTRARLKNEKVIWFVTAGRDHKPQAVPVWFYWDSRSFLIYAQNGRKARHVRENPYVELHLNSDEVGNDVVRASGYATIRKGSKPNADYSRKYRTDIKDLEMTTEGFYRQFGNTIRVRRLRFR